MVGKGALRTGVTGAVSERPQAVSRNPVQAWAPAAKHGPRFDDPKTGSAEARQCKPLCLGLALPFFGPRFEDRPF